MNQAPTNIYNLLTAAIAELDRLDDPATKRGLTSKLYKARGLVARRTTGEDVVIIGIARYLEEVCGWPSVQAWARGATADHCYKLAGNAYAHGFLVGDVDLARAGELLHDYCLTMAELGGDQ